MIVIICSLIYAEASSERASEQALRAAWQCQHRVVTNRESALGLPPMSGSPVGPKGRWCPYESGPGREQMTLQLD